MDAKREVNDMLSEQLKQIYNQHIRSVPPDQKLELIALISKELAAELSKSEYRKPKSLLDL